MSPTPFGTESGRSAMQRSGVMLDGAAVRSRLDTMREQIRAILVRVDLTPGERLAWKGRFDGINHRVDGARDTEVALLVASGYVSNLDAMLTRWHERRSL